MKKYIHKIASFILFGTMFSVVCFSVVKLLNLLDQSAYTLQLKRE